MRWIANLLPVLLVACMPALPPAQPDRAPVYGDQLLTESFDVPGIDWQTLALEGAQIDYAPDESGDGAAYRIQAGVAGFVNGSYRGSLPPDVIVEADAFPLSDTRKGIYGLTCRLDSQGYGYYFLVSPDGNASIRYLAPGRDVALVKWQEHGAIEQGKRLNRLRAVCIGDYLALYVNGEFVADARDSRRSQGTISMTAALTTRSTDPVMDVIFDNVRVWAGA